MSEQRDDALVTVVVGEEHLPEDPGSRAPVSWDLDPVCAAAVDVARDALLEEAAAPLVGEHEDVLAEGPMVVTHFFTGHVPGYVGWRWAVTVSRTPDSEHVTVDETALLPSGDALLAPAWVPWKQRIESGDLGPGDVMVTEADDTRLIPGMADNDVPESDDQLRPEQWELGLGRERILSPEGRREAARRWYREMGPKASTARATELECASCGFLMLLGGPLGQGFGVCANGYSPADGRVVALNFGCGAHSETREVPSVGVAETVVDEVGFDDLGAVTEDVDEPAAEQQGSVDDEAATADDEASVEQEEGTQADPTQEASASQTTGQEEDG
jgi:hypothetical protein